VFPARNQLRKSSRQDDVTVRTSLNDKVARQKSHSVNVAEPFCSPPTSLGDSPAKAFQDARGSDSPKTHFARNKVYDGPPRNAGQGMADKQCKGNPYRQRGRLTGLESALGHEE